MIEIENLTKRFPTRDGEIVAVDNLSLAIEPGQIFGFLGPNGAGKTTTIRMLTCLLRPTSGTARINGLTVGVDDQAIRHKIGLLTETPGLYDTMSAEKNLTLFGRLYGLDDARKQAHRFLQMLDLWDRRSDPVGSFSKGMRQKLAIARSALHDPELLFLDEPTSGLDPDIAKLVRDFILELKSDGRTIFLCTHNLDEADRLCDIIGIFKHRLIVADTAANLRRQLFGREQIFRLRRLEAEWVRGLYEMPFISQARAAANEVYLRVENPEEQNPVIVRLLVEWGAEIQQINEVSHSLEEVYLQLITEAGATS
ncbi:MAG: ABC transporter ATP-binding protein [Verrucomicrobiota bacterium]